MCEKCIELDDKIYRYGRLSKMITDERTLQALKQAISRMEASAASAVSNSDLKPVDNDHKSFRRRSVGSWRLLLRLRLVN
jgi:hypothetical protein